ncbi:complement factor H isoform X2 [Larimichthys crocea]|uniref:complement factor H isoform X2 n=1 Tax=Larimichthys crocea TaxID=215358 RepID=UPI000F5E1A70|nr:complement factor H isoform X2 [Larimichthys crocea]
MKATVMRLTWVLTSEQQHNVTVRVCHSTSLNFGGKCPQQSLTGFVMTCALHSALILIPDKMYLRYLGFVLLVWFAGALHAQSAAQPCHAPRLDNGYFVPEQHMYAHESMLTYACDNKHKPVIENWWAKITCQNGNWSHKPQCIDEKACFAPTIPNANYTKNQDGWYEEGYKIRITCDTGYEPKNNDATAICTNGTWSSVPVCEKSIFACGEPPQFPHAVIIHHYQEVFAVDSEVQYECEDGYTVEGAENKKSILCISGVWTEGPTCSRETEAGTGSTVEGTDRETRPSTRGTSDSGTPSTGGGSSTSSFLNGRDSTPLMTTVNNCGAYPVVPNSVAVKESEYILKYQCNNYYKHDGPETVMCHSDGSWSELPVCKEAFCTLNPGRYVRSYVKLSAVEYIPEGETKQFPCIGYHYHTSIARCTQGRITLSYCCTWDDRIYRGCGDFTAEYLGYN